MSEHKRIDEDFYQIYELVKTPKTTGKPLFPVGRQTFMKGVAEGLYPAPIKIGKRILVWKKTSIDAIFENGVLPGKGA